jgi:hypothetical protein
MLIKRPTHLRSGIVAFAIMTLGLLPASPAKAQDRQFDVRGVVNGSDGAGLQGAMVVALTRADSILTKYALSSGQGTFTLSRVPVGEYILQVTSMGYQTFRRDFSVTSGDVDAGPVNMELAPVGMDTLFVNPEHIPFVNRRDTLDYNVLAFPTRPNATVEELLARLPGIEVDADGSIKAQGEDVQNVLVEGKEFFGSDPTIATRNLPAEAVERVQVYDKQSDMAEFTGIPDGQEERTINLELNEDARVGYFGRLASGMGADGGFIGVHDTPGKSEFRHNETLSLNKFSPTTQLAVVGNLNNTNQAGFSGADIQAFGGGGGMGGMGGMGGVSRGGGNGVGGNREGFTEALSVGFNASRDFGKDSWIRGSYFLSDLENLKNTTIQQQQLLGSEVSSLSDQANDQNTDNFTHKVDVNAQYTFSEGNDLRLRGGFNANASTILNVSSQETRTVAGEILNTAETTNSVDGDDLSGNARLTWRKKLHENGRTIVAEAWGSLSRPDMMSQLNSLTGSVVRGDVLTYDEIIQEQERTGHTFTQSQRLSLTQPLGRGYVMELFGLRRAVSEDQNKEVYDLQNGTSVFNDPLSSEFERTYSYLQGGFRFNRNTDDSWFVASVQVQNSDLDGTIVDRDERIQNGYTHVLPSMNYRYQFKPGTNLNLNYRASTREPTLNELQPFTDNSNPLSTYVGNPDLTPEYTHTLRGEYRYFDMFSFVNLFTHFNVSYTTDDIVLSRTVDEKGFQDLTSLNAGEAWSARTGFNFGRPIRALGIRAEVDYTVQYSKASEFINLAKNESRILRNTVDLSLGNRDKEIFDVEAGGQISFNDVEYSLNEEFNQSYANSTLYARGQYYLDEVWTFSSDLAYQLYDKDVFGPGQNVALWKASISRLFMNDRTEVQLIAYDLLNQNQVVNFNSSANSIRETRVESLGHYLILNVNYKLGLGSGGPRGHMGGGGMRR